jgi:hypothetical protein
VGVSLLILLPLSGTDMNYKLALEWEMNKTTTSYDDFDKITMGNIQVPGKPFPFDVVLASNFLIQLLSPGPKFVSCRNRAVIMGICSCNVLGFV